MEHESPEARRARRLAEARAARGTPEREAQVKAMLEAKAIAEAEEKAKRPVRGSTSSTPRTPRTPKAPPDPAANQPGHTLTVWMAMRGVALAHLQACAKVLELTTADTVWQLVKDSRPEVLGDPKYQLPKLLGYVETKSLEETGFLASSLIVAPDRGNEPGPDFFRFAHKRGLLPAEDAPPASDVGWTMTDAQRAFWQHHVNGMFERFS